MSARRANARNPESTGPKAAPGGKRDIDPPVKMAGRVRLLIGYYHGGSVNDAARTLGIPQRTLADIVDGRVSNPRAVTLAAIARGFSVSIDWLVSGAGEDPDFLAPGVRSAVPEVRALLVALRPLKLSNELISAVAEIP